MSKLACLYFYFSHIDQSRKNDFKRELFAYLKEKNIACIVATHDMADVLPFSDQIMAMQNSQVMKYGETKAVYQKPININVAKLFGDANEVTESLIKALDLTREKKVLYSSELKISVENGIKVVIINKYFHGSQYLYLVKYKAVEIIFETEQDLPIGSFVWLNYKN
jgi:ABC-type Fe3+/spermidine/putrescine transport system ATPase subunit